LQRAKESAALALEPFANSFANQPTAVPTCRTGAIGRNDVQKPGLILRQTQRNPLNQTADPNGNRIRLLLLKIREELPREYERGRPFRLENQFGEDPAFRPRLVAVTGTGPL